MYLESAPGMGDGQQPREGTDEMQRVIEEILKTEEGCAGRLEQERRLFEQRRSEVETECSERVRATKERLAQDASARIAAYHEKLRGDSETRIRSARDDAERQFEKNQARAAGIVDRIVQLVIGVSRTE